MKKTSRKAALLCSAALLIGSMSVFPQPERIGAEETEIFYTEGFNSGEGGWKGRGDASVAQTDSEVYEGTGALSVTGRGDTWNGCSYDISESWFSAGSDLSFSASVYNSGRSDIEIMLSLQYEDGQTSYDHIASATIPSKSWGTVSTGSYTVPSGSDYSLYFETAAGTSNFIVDDIMIGSKGAISASSFTAGESAGDLNGDGVVNIADMVILKSQILAPKSATYMSDVNADSSLDTNDFVYMFGYLCGAYQSFPTPVKPEVPVEPEVPQSDYKYSSDINFHEIPGNYFNEPGNGGKLTKESYNGINGGNTCNVYTPPGYDPSQKYNIFYLMHGGGENENTLFYQDDTNIKPVLDNMILNGEIDPMIVVTPTFNKTEAGKFYSEFRQSLVPFIEGKYSTYAESTDQAGLEASRMHRAYGGFSMGGVSTWAVMENCLDIVAYFMPLSGDHWNGNSAYDKAKSIANAVDKSGYADKFYIFCATGSTDIAYPNVSPQIEEMKKMSQFKYTADYSQGNLYFLVVPGKDHWWGNVRHYVYDGLPNFFREY